MMIHEITALVGKDKARKRIGRGRGSGRGKTSGRGHKGDGSRSGYHGKGAFEGGQMPYFRRLPKRGFTNMKFMTQFWIVNLRDIVAHPSFSGGGDVNAGALIQAGLIRDTKRPLKILGDVGEAGKLGVKLNVTAERVTASARRHIESAGGSVQELGTRRDKVRGVDRDGGDSTPKNLTLKLHRVRKGEKRREEFAAKAQSIAGKNNPNAAAAETRAQGKAKKPKKGADAE
ncbi:MAG: 50S ribosomal protein L15 [Phycisphaeraceae bacterium]|nr:50S ribosomal protein L15 [Phycisphaeraceae bacterium]MCB9847295.1 50S ribosomal protein L15 [Phycisphaeraceae bacterium]